MPGCSRRRRSNGGTGPKSRSTVFSLNPWHIRLAARAVEAGGVIAYPTETVFGLGCNPWHRDAVARILQLKRRPRGKGLIVVAASMAQLRSLVRLDDTVRIREITASWPGPVTWVLPARRGTPAWLTGGRNTLAVRVSPHPVVRRLCERCGPLVSTSANPSRGRPAGSTQAVRNYFGCRLDFILPGRTDTKVGPSEIRDGLSGATLRPGGSNRPHSGHEPPPGQTGERGEFGWV